MLKTYWRMVLSKKCYPAPSSARPRAEIRSFDRDTDVPAVARLYGDAFNDQAWAPTWADFPGFDSRGVFLAEENAQLVGFVVSYVRTDSENLGYVSVVAIAPSHRRRGIATALIRRAVDRFWNLGFEQVAVDVAADNLPPLTLYQSLGFAKTEEFIADEHCRRPTGGQGSE